MREREEGLRSAGAALLQWRQEAGLSQVAAAERIRVSQAAWAAWERGEKGPDLHSAFELEKLTDGSVRAESWAFPRKGSKAAGAEATGEHAALPDSSTGTEG